MATDTFSSADSALPNEAELFDRLRTFAKTLLSPFASLKLTVGLFATSIFIIFVGTLAQVEKDMWEVMDLYFRSFFAWIDFQLFFPRSWFPSLVGKVPGGFPMPGGFLIGLLMAVNLLAAHSIRFKIQSKGSALLLGLAVIGVGVAVTYWVIASGHNQSGLQGEPPFSWQTLWKFVQGSLVVLTLASVVALAISKTTSSIQRFGWFAVAIVCGVLAGWAASTMPSPSSLRILWQLIQGGLSGLILLMGCLLAFRKRAGIVLLHSGIALIMYSEFFVGQYAVEGRMMIREGETMNYLRDIRSVELAIIDSSAEDLDSVIAIPRSRLQPQEKWWDGLTALSGESYHDEKITIQDDRLPFDIRVESFFSNSNLVDVKSDEENFANSGSGKRLIAEQVRSVSGTDGGEVNVAAVYVDVLRKGSGESLGRYLLSQLVSMNDVSEKVEVDGKTYDVSLRFKRTYKPYSLSLQDVRKDDYLGTNTPMNYSSDVRLIDDGRQVGNFKIWMNNPLRYSGETFYQSNYSVDRDGTEVTDFQVVTNTGWMMPYVGCMLVAVGMLTHFSMTLWRFLSRLSREQTEFTTSKWYEYAIPVMVVMIFVGYVGSKLRPPTDTKANMRLHEFGKLPVVYQGRVKPIDTLARNTLRIISNKDTFEDEQGNELPAIRWLLDVISQAAKADEHRIFRIDNLDVIETLGLQRRKGFRYAETEFTAKIEEFDRQLREARELDPAQLSFYQKKLIEVEQRIRAVRKIQAAFMPIPVPELPTQEEFENNREEALNQLARIKFLLQQSQEFEVVLERMEPPLAVPVGGEKEWATFSTAWNAAYAAQFAAEPQRVARATVLWDKMLRSYAAGDTKGFNTAVEDYRQLLVDAPPDRLAETKTAVAGVPIAKIPFEFFFNYSQPFKYSLVMYIVSFVLVALGWLAAAFGHFKVFNRTAFWLLVFAFAVHTFALASRVIISGRPPITNLYSSAVFIGWAAVGIGLVLEWIYGMGIGNVMASVAGFSTLQIAYALAADGDTFTVLQAVLDTQFWLATHVVCVTLGYSTTFAAGLLGAIYLLSMAWRFPKLGKALTSMTYGTLCFAIFFSFVGTVLGGLWADDSWGRFWGWDPKENGALMIVLWNALVLHARWGAIVKQRGLAKLVIVGNIVTAWSWFGVNELGVGLHSYGFTEGVLWNLGLFVLSQLAIIVFGFAAVYFSTAGPPNEKTKVA